MIKVFPDIEELSNFAAEKFVEIGNRAIEEKGWFLVVLSGGSTPKALYRVLAAEFKSKLDWRKVYFFFGDERNVPASDEQSNFHTAYETLLKPLEILPAHFLRWQTELVDADIVAADYEKTLGTFVAVRAHAGDPGRFWIPQFDLILLGMGADGHTASLFPNTEALNETEKLAVANKVEKLNTVRLTITFPVINNAANVIFLVTGAEKAEALREVLQGEHDPEKFPAQNVKPDNGNLLWLVDAPAAQGLEDSKFKIQD